LPWLPPDHLGEARIARIARAAYQIPAGFDISQLVIVSNLQSPNNRLLLLEVLRDTPAEAVEISLSNRGGIPLAKPATTYGDSGSPAPPFSEDPVLDLPLPLGPRAEVFLDLPPSYQQEISLLLTTPSNAKIGAILRVDLVARRPEDGKVVGALTIRIEIV
jgi:hypothetical protein